MFAAALPGLVMVLLVGALFAGARTASRIDVAVVNDDLVVRIRGKDRLFALSRGTVIPLSSVAGVAVAPRSSVPAKGLRLPGTGIPGILRAGSYGTGAKRDFWLVRRAKEVLVIELQPGQPYRRLVLEMPDAHATCLRIRPATGAYTGSFAQ
jgi:hypothetical protein